MSDNKQFIKDAIRTESNLFFPTDPRVLHASIGLVTESAELADALKKSMFYGKELDLLNVKEEAGDILWYLAILFDAIGTDFDTEMNRVIEKLKGRFPDKFTMEKAEVRNLPNERRILAESEQRCLESPYGYKDVNFADIHCPCCSLPKSLCKEL